MKTDSGSRIASKKLKMVLFQDISSAGLSVVKKQEKNLKKRQEEREGRSWESKMENRMECMERNKVGVSKRSVAEGEGKLETQETL